MSARDVASADSWPVAQHSALGKATRAVVIGGLPEAFGYAALQFDGDVDVQFFSDWKSMTRSLAVAFTQGGRWQWPLSWEAVYFFKPDEHLRLYMVIEHGEDDADEVAR